MWYSQTNYENKTRRVTEFKFHRLMVVPRISYGLETWVTSGRTLGGIQVTEMRLLRSVEGCLRMDRLLNDVML